MRHVLTLLLLAAAPASAADSHCTTQEQTIFSCRVAKSKVVSLCASSPLTRDAGTLAYRFGTLGKAELQFPRSPENSLRQFRHAHYPRYRTERTDVSFSIGSYRYAVFDYYEGEESPPRTRGVRVTAGDGSGKETSLACIGAVQSRLHELEGLVPCDRDNPLASCH